MAGLRSMDIWPWSFVEFRSAVSEEKLKMSQPIRGQGGHLEPSRSRSQKKVPMETTHEGLSTSDVLKS